MWILIIVFSAALVLGLSLPIYNLKLRRDSARAKLKELQSGPDNDELIRELKNANQRIHNMLPKVMERSYYNDWLNKCDEVEILGRKIGDMSCSIEKLNQNATDSSIKLAAKEKEYAVYIKHVHEQLAKLQLTKNMQDMLQERRVEKDFV